MNENKALIKWMRNELEKAIKEKENYGENHPLYGFWNGKKQTLEETLSKLGVIVSVDFKQTSDK